MNETHPKQLKPKKDFFPQEFSDFLWFEKKKKTEEINHLPLKYWAKSLCVKTATKIDLCEDDVIECKRMPSHPKNNMKPSTMPIFWTVFIFETDFDLKKRLD